MIDANVLRCPECGAPSDPKAAQCSYCKVALNPLRCPWCFAWSYSEHNCPHCGATAAQPCATPLHCPTCNQGELTSRMLGQARLSGCGRCGGVWADATSFRNICEDRQTQAAYLGPGSVAAAPMQSDPAEKSICYRPCAQCGDLMNRVNFAGCSGVIVDVCKPHGVWFDPDELRRIVVFIRDGGLDLARRRELENLTEERRQLETAQARASAFPPMLPLAGPQVPWHLASARGLLGLLFDVKD